MKAEKKILFITPHFPPNQSVGTQRIVKLIKYLRQQGWEVFVLTLKEKYYSGQAVIDYQLFLKDTVHVVRTGKIDPFLWWDRLKRRLRRNSRRTPFNRPASVPGAASGGKQTGSWLFRIKEFITRMMQYPDRENGWILPVFFHAFRLIRQYQIPFVLASSPPHSPYIALNALHRWVDFIYITDFRDPWARSQWSKEVRNAYEKTARYLDLRYEQKTLKTADILIFNNEVLQKEYWDCYPDSGIREKSVVVTNGFDPQLTDIERVWAPRSTRGKPEMVIIHAGTLYKKRDPYNIFQAFLKFREAYPDVGGRVRFKFLGHVTPDLQYLYRFVEEQQLQNQVAFLPSRPYQAALQEMQRADWLLILQPVTRIQVPAKFFDYLTVPRPIWGVVEPGSISEKLIQRLRVGLVSYNSVEASIMQFFHFLRTHPGPSFEPDSREMQKFMVPNIVRQLETVLLSRMED